MYTGSIRIFFIKIRTRSQSSNYP